MGLGKFSKQKQIKCNFSIFFFKFIKQTSKEIGFDSVSDSLMLKNLLYALSGVAILLSITQMRIPPLNLILRQVSTIMAKEVTVEPYSMAFVTAPNKDVAKTLAGGLVEKKLAACVNIIPGIISVYEWEGKIENDEEVLMMIKTRTSRIPELTDYVKTNH